MVAEVLRMLFFMLLLVGSGCVVCCPGVYRIAMGGVVWVPVGMLHLF